MRHRIKLNMETVSFILHLGALVCFFAVVVSFCVAFYAGLLVYSRTWKPGDRSRELSWGERAGRGMSRSEFLVADDFKSLRRLYFGAWASAFGSFALLGVLTVLLKRA
jgi:hypothetical protein